MEDKLIWALTEGDKFMVKSAYYLALNRKLELKGNGSNSEQVNSKWKILWQLTVPPKVKIFLWRLIHNSLPTKENLFHRRVVDNPLCLLCNQEPESMVHTVWNCSTANDV